MRHQCGMHIHLLEFCPLYLQVNRLYAHLLGALYVLLKHCPHIVSFLCPVSLWHAPIRLNAK